MNEIKNNNQPQPRGEYACGNTDEFSNRHVINPRRTCLKRVFS